MHTYYRNEDRLSDAFNVVVNVGVHSKCLPGASTETRVYQDSRLLLATESSEVDDLDHLGMFDRSTQEISQPKLMCWLASARYVRLDSCNLMLFSI